MEASERKHIEITKERSSLTEPIEQLIKKAKLGDHQAFKQLVVMHERQVMATVTGMLGDVETAKDISQQVFIRFFRSLADYRGDSRLGTYLTRIAINLSLNEIKRKQRTIGNLNTYKSDLGTNPVIDHSASPEQLETRQLVQSALQQLPDEARAVIVLRMIEGYSTKETAEILGLPMGTIGSRLSRAQDKLKSILKQLI
ncbi:MAG: RNA polymerase sigma factor [Bacteroidota bacterium]